MTIGSKFFTDQNGDRFESLPDLISDQLDVLSIGLNPGIRSIEAGFYFANPRNRFWRLLNSSGLCSKACQPSLEANLALFEYEGIGFTDVVKRPTSGASDLRSDDFQFWAPVLREHLEANQPAVAWFHGKVAYRNFLRANRLSSDDTEWGVQPRKLAKTLFFVSPNPSPANAAFSDQTIGAFYSQLASLIRGGL